MDKTNNEDAAAENETDQTRKTNNHYDAEIDTEEIRLVENAYIYLTKHVYPMGCTKNEKRSIRRKSEKLLVKDGVLHYKKKKGNVVRLITNVKEREQILASCHKDKTSGHMGTKRTLARISERFIWPGVAKDVYQMVETCDVCQRTGRKIQIAAPELHPVPVVSPWHHIGIDFVGPLSPPSRQGSQYILTVSDYFTKFVHAVPTKTKQASAVADALFKIFMKFGLPRVVTSDQGGEFNNHLDTKLMDMLDIEHRLTTPYHPQANGLDERFNQTLQKMIVKYVADKKECWEDFLDTCVFAYNTSKHESSKFTPFEVMFSRRAVLPIDLTMQGEAEKVEMLEFDDEVLDIAMQKRRECLEDVKRNIVIAQKRQKEQYDRKHSNPSVFRVGGIVLKKDFTRSKRKGGKLDLRWLGPYRIVKSLGCGLFRLEGIDNPSTVVGRVNGVHLKHYHQPKTTDSVSENESTESTASDSSVNQEPDTSDCPASSLGLELSPPSLSRLMTNASLDSGEVSVNGEGIVSSTPIVEGGFFVDFFATGDPDKPSALRPDKPSALRPDKPSARRPDKPSARRPEKPSALRPDKPSSPRPDKPSARRPDKPSALRPDKPSSPRPDKPSAPRPDKLSWGTSPELSCTCRTKCNGKKRCPCRGRGKACSSRCHPGYACSNTTMQ